MKSIFRLFVLLTIFVAILAFAPFQSNVSAQTTNSETKTDEITEKEKKEVKKFVDEFIKILDKKKDLSKVPERFFVADFKTRFAKKESFYSVYASSEFFKQLRDSERYEASVSSFNFSYLTIISAIGNNQINFDEDSDKEIDFTKTFPPNIIALMNKNNRLSSALTDSENGDDTIKSISQLYELIGWYKTIIEAQRTYLNEQSQHWQKTYARKIKKIRQKLISYSIETCRKNTCEGLPENTRMIRNRVVPFDLYIIRENDKLRILNIHPISD